MQSFVTALLPADGMLLAGEVMAERSPNIVVLLSELIAYDAHAQREGILEMPPATTPCSRWCVRHGSSAWPGIGTGSSLCPWQQWY